MTPDVETDPAKIAARVVKGLVAMRGAAAKLHSASVDRHRHEMRVALTAIDTEYYLLRDYLNQVVVKAPQSAE